MTLASKIGKFLPNTLFDYLQPKFHFYRSKRILKKEADLTNTIKLTEGGF